jgi:hypothetical protein
MSSGWVCCLPYEVSTMKVHCSWCEKAGRDPFMGEKEPLHDPSVSHGLCQRCLEEMTQQTAALLGPKKPTSNPPRRKRRRR